MERVFQHTYEGSKLNGLGGGAMGGVSSSIPTRVRNTCLRRSTHSSIAVPAYLRGFETVYRLFRRWQKYGVPAYLRGFETFQYSKTITKCEAFQHTYEGSKLSMMVGLTSPWISGSSIHTRVRNHLIMMPSMSKYACSSILYFRLVFKIPMVAILRLRDFPSNGCIYLLNLTNSPSPCVMRLKYTQ